MIFIEDRFQCIEHNVCNEALIIFPSILSHQIQPLNKFF